MNTRRVPPRPCLRAYDAGAMLDHPLTIAGEAVLLMPERALFWSRVSTLFVADTHWGKTAAFRAGGIPVPAGTTRADLARLSACLDRTEAARLVILGDLLHARLGRYEPATLDAIEAWRFRHPDLEVLLVRGNHDRAAGPPDPAWRFETVDEPHPLAPFVLRHVPRTDDRGYVLAGHVHPAVRLTAGGESLKLPCFHISRMTAILPAFSSFADGTAVERIGTNECVYVIADDEVLPAARS